MFWGNQGEDIGECECWLSRKLKIREKKKWAGKADIVMTQSRLRKPGKTDDAHGI